MKAPAAIDKPARTFGWPRSPAILFGIAAAFFAIMGLILIASDVLGTQMPVPQNGAVSHVPSGDLWLPVALPFVIFAVIYAALEFGADFKFDESTTRIHFVCTLFAVMEGIRVYFSWAATTANVSPEEITAKSFAGVFAFLILSAAVFVWNVLTIQVESKPAAVAVKLGAEAAHLPGSASPKS